jgi:hypothetical protein
MAMRFDHWRDALQTFQDFRAGLEHAGIELTLTPADGMATEADPNGVVSLFKEAQSTVKVLGNPGRNGSLASEAVEADIECTLTFEGEETAARYRTGLSHTGAGVTIDAPFQTRNFPVRRDHIIPPTLVSYLRDGIDHVAAAEKRKRELEKNIDTNEATMARLRRDVPDLSALGVHVTVSAYTSTTADPGNFQAKVKVNIPPGSESDITKALARLGSLRRYA